MFSRRQVLTWFIPADTALDRVDILLHYGGYVTTPGETSDDDLPNALERISLSPLRISLEETTSIDRLRYSKLISTTPFNLWPLFFFTSPPHEPGLKTRASAGSFTRFALNKHIVFILSIQHLLLNPDKGYFLSLSSR